MTIDLIRGDITKQTVDAIVNAANSSLLGGGGVDGAIHRAGGPDILAECRAIRARQGQLHTGGAVITTAGRMPARYVIHTVGPVYNKGGAEKAALLKDCYLNSLRLAAEHEVRTIAFPNISTGVYGYPKAEAAQVAIEAVRSYDGELPERVVFVCFDEENYDLYRRILAA